MDRLAHNMRYVAHAVGNRTICAAVKANAYGHGLIEVARFLQGCTANTQLCFGVATVDEGVCMREAGITGSIILFGYADSSEWDALVEYGLEPFVGDVQYARGLAACARQHETICAVHLKVDSGMGRIGCTKEKVRVLYEYLVGMSGVSVRALCTHLADAQNTEYTTKQVAYFEEACARVWDNTERAVTINSAEDDERASNAAHTIGATGLPRHCANSSAILCGSAPLYEMVRPGIMLYGYDSDPCSSYTKHLKPVMELRSKIMYIKRIKKGQSVSYGMSWQSTRDTLIATIPLGYGDGYSRRFSNIGEMLVEVTPQMRYTAPVVGRICMDQCMLDVGDVPGVALHHPVTVFGDDAGILGADVLARKVDTIAYEITTAIQERVPRVFDNAK